MKRTETSVFWMSKDRANAADEWFLEICVNAFLCISCERSSNRGWVCFNVASDLQRMLSLYLNHMQIALRHHATVKFELHAPD